MGRTISRVGFLALFGALTLGCGSDDSKADGKGGSGGTAGTGGAAGSGGAAGAAGTGGASGPFELALGEVADVELTDGQAHIDLATPAGNEVYALIVASTLLDGSKNNYDYSLTPGPVTDPSKLSLATGCSINGDTWSKQKLPTETPPSGTPAKVGDQKSIAMGSELITIEVVAVGASAVVWADVTPAHPAVLDSAVVQEFLTDFETIILPRERTIFGTESDLDNDGHIQLVFSPLTYDTAVAYFSNCDLAPSAFCPSVNNGEYLYLTPPNAIDPPYNTPKAIKEILAHELSHMIHFGRKVLKNKLGGWSDSAYLAEGIGGFAQDASGYQAGNFYVTRAALDGIQQYSLGQTFADNVQYDMGRDGVLRGGSYLFVRWFYDRAGADKPGTGNAIDALGGPQLLHTLIEAPESVAAKLPDATTSSAADLAIDFWTTLAMSNRDVIGGVAPKNGCFAYLPTVADPITSNQRGANLYASFHGQQMKGPALQPSDAVDATLEAGGGELIQLDANGSELAFTLAVEAAAAPRVRIGRIR